MYDVYLGGYADVEWRNTFAEAMTDDVTIMDPIDESYDQLNRAEKADLVAKELQFIEQSRVVVFFLDPDWKSYFSMLQLGDAVGRGRQVIVCLNGAVESEDKIRRFCEYRGVMVVENLDDLITVTEEMLGQIELCSYNPA